jgi:hypothetical protein
MISGAKALFRSRETWMTALWFSSDTVFSVCPYRLFPLLSVALEFFP